MVRGVSRVVRPDAFGGAVNLSCDVQQAYSVEQRGGLGYRNAFAAQDSDDFGAQ